MRRAPERGQRGRPVAADSMEVRPRFISTLATRPDLHNTRLISMAPQMSPRLVTLSSLSAREEQEAQSRSPNSGIRHRRHPCETAGHVKIRRKRQSLVNSHRPSRWLMPELGGSEERYGDSGAHVRWHPRKELAGAILSASGPGRLVIVGKLSHDHRPCPPHPPPHAPPHAHPHPHRLGGPCSAS